MKKQNTLVASALAVLSIATAGNLIGCSNGLKSERKADGLSNKVTYETEYIFEEVWGRIAFTELYDFDGEKSLDISSADYVQSGLIKDGAGNSMEITVSATDDFKKNLGSDWRKYKCEFGLTDNKTYYDSPVVYIMPKENFPVGNYRIEFAMKGMQCVKHTYEYLNGKKINSTTEVVGKFAPIKEPNNLSQAPFATLTGYDTQSGDIVYTAYPYINLTVLLGE